MFYKETASTFNIKLIRLYPKKAHVSISLNQLIYDLHFHFQLTQGIRIFETYFQNTLFIFALPFWLQNSPFHLFTSKFSDNDS